MSRYTEPHTTNTPLDNLINKEEYDEELDKDNREHQLIQLLKETLLFILEQDAKKPETVILGVLYALQDHTTLELSQRQRAKEIGCSHYTISKYTGLYKKQMGIR